LFFQISTFKIVFWLFFQISIFKMQFLYLLSGKSS